MITTLLPVVYNLAVGWWLLGSALLSRRAYPESSKTAGRFSPPADAAAPASVPVQKHELNERPSVEKKLAALVAKPKDDPAA